MTPPITRRYIRWPLGISAVTALAAAALFIACTMAGAEATPVPPTMDVLLLAAVGGAALTLVLLAMRRRRWRDKLFLLLLPLLVIPLVNGAFMIPASDAGRARLVDGRVVHLSIGPGPSDVSYDLWQESHGGWWWRRTTADLSYSEDGRFIGDERLTLSRDGRRLLVRRGGIWTDCLEVQVGFKPCALGSQEPRWDEPDFAARMRARSAVMDREVR